MATSMNSLVEVSEGNLVPVSPELLTHILSGMTAVDLARGNPLRTDKEFANIYGIFAETCRVVNEG